MLKIVFFGSSTFSSVILNKLSKTKFCPFLIATTKNSNLKTDIPIKFFPFLIKEADLFIVASFGRILSKKILSIPKYGSLNIHPSLLPKHRGPSPLQQTILNNDQKTGTTIILMDELIDHGKIVSQKEYLIKQKETFLSLEKKLAEISADLLIKTIPDWISKKIIPIYQKEEQATYTHLFQKEDGKIDWQESSDIIERKIRALNPWPGCFTFWKKNNKDIRIKILRAKNYQKNISDIPGKVYDNLTIQCKKGTLVIELLQIEGKKPVLAQDFLKGNKINESILF
ncbi:MAG: methionyl-tRNA formyltransferase [Candidatus Pacebacteria bacterium]|nr:methionyl-tRNA formyltransferase [Candidatus Paceibacterota bacterium]